MSDQDNSSQGQRPQGSSEDASDPFTWQISRVEGDDTDHGARQMPAPPPQQPRREGTIDLSGPDVGAAGAPLAQYPHPVGQAPAAPTSPQVPAWQPQPMGQIPTDYQVPQEPAAPAVTLPGTGVPSAQLAERPRRGSAATIALFALGIAAAFGCGYLISNTVFSDQATVETATAAETGPASDGTIVDGDTASAAGEANGQTAAPALDVDDETGDSGAAVDADGVTLELIESVEPTEENPAGAVRYAIYRDGKIFLRGFARDEEAVERLVGSFATVFGPANVVNEYELNPASPRWTEAPIYFSDAVFFDVNSAEIRPNFYLLLERTARLVDLGPFVSVRVVAMTDATGSATYNRELAQRRADAVVDFYVEELGIDRFRFQSEVLGEDRATEAADEETAATERRVELVVSGIRG